MINEIKTMIQNYLNNAKLCNITQGTVEHEGIRISEKIVIPSELIKGNLKNYISPGDKVNLIRNHGGKEYYIFEILEKDFVIKGSFVTLSIDGSMKKYKVEDVTK